MVQLPTGTFKSDCNNWVGGGSGCNPVYRHEFELDSNAQLVGKVGYDATGMRERVCGATGVTGWNTIT